MTIVVLLVMAVAAVLFVAAIIVAVVTAVLSSWPVSIVSAARSMAEGTSVEPGGGAERAPTARPEAWEPRAYGGAGKGGVIEVVRRQNPREGEQENKEPQGGQVVSQRN